MPNPPIEATPALVQLLIDRLFAPEQRPAASGLLEGYGTAAHEREPDRVRVAALKLSGGNLAKLEGLITHARQDYRDVLAWAEYPDELAQPTWKLSPQEVARIRQADRAQYLDWLGRATGTGTGTGTGTAGADRSSPANGEATSNQPHPAPQSLLTLRLGSLNLTGVGAVIGLIVLLGLLTALLVWIKPTLRMSLSAALWTGFVVYWNAAAKNAAPTVKAESQGSRALHQRLLLLSMFLLFVPIPGLRQRLWSSTRWLVAIGLIIQALSILLAALARRHLGRNWSGAITVAAGHQLVRTGPYRLIRHPIYTAILGLFVGTLLVSGELHALLGLLVVSVAYWRKIRLEEQNLVEIFGPAYDAYRRESWILFPGIL